MGRSWGRRGRRGSLRRSRIGRGERRRGRECRRGGRAGCVCEMSEWVRKMEEGLTRRLAEEVELEETR